MSYVLTLVGISLLIALHELGHFLMARACGMAVERFSIGFGPAIWSRRIGETVYQLAAIPLGGYVQIEGMGGAVGDGSDAPPNPRSYTSKALWQRALVVLAGPLANWVVCAVLLVILAASSGLPETHLNQARLGDLMPGGAASEAGLQSGDQVLRIGDAPVSDWPTMVAAITPHKDQALVFVLERDGVPMNVTVTPKAGPGGVGVIGVTPYVTRTVYGPLMALPAGIQGAWQKTTEQAQMLIGMATGAVNGRLSGLPGIVKAVTAQGRESFGSFLNALAYLSIGLCLLNLLPIPGLDGSHLCFLGVEAVRRKPMGERAFGVIQTAGFLFLVGLMIFVSVRDLL